MKGTYNPPRLLLAATGSGTGKTTCTCAILRALQRRGLRLHSFKCGPDYIDPMFHTRVLGVPSYNLDTVLCGPAAVCDLLAAHAGGCNLSLIEGVMGLYDGRSMMEEQDSTNQLALLTGTPTVLVVDVRGMGRSLAALVEGYLRFAPNQVQGLLLSRCKPAMFPVYRELLQQHCEIPVYGYLPPVPQAVLASRHLGLVTAGEVADLQHKLDLLADEAESSIDLEGLLDLAKTGRPFIAEPLWPDLTSTAAPVRIGLAWDAAFCFFYQDNLDLLRCCGAQIVPFSPVKDKHLPKDLGGLILPGGYPEMYGRQLSHNESMLADLRQAAAEDMPIYAECGGFMYLQQAITDQDGERWPMAGILPGESSMGQRLCRFGYHQLTAKRDTLLFKAGEQVMAHEFHYADSSCNGDAFTAQKGGRSWECVAAKGQIFAGYPHLHWAGAPQIAQRFVDSCRAYRKNRGTAP